MNERVRGIGPGVSGWPKKLMLPSLSWTVSAAGGRRGKVEEAWRCSYPMGTVDGTPLSRVADLHVCNETISIPTQTVEHTKNILICLHCLSATLGCTV